ncbi:MAG: hypothetical protein HKN08_06750, partial [Gammaproteobacteria bacterium]|nr:hypothetical protein [Gammaproteobacteria bacterium]
MNSTNKSWFRYNLVFAFLCPLLFISCAQKSVEIDFIRGIYGHPKPFWDKEINLSELGVNSIFVHSGSISHDMVKRAKADGLLVFAEFATLNGKNYVEEHPEAWAINEKGEKVKAASWFMGVCPTEPGSVSIVLISWLISFRSMTWTVFGWIMCIGMRSLRNPSPYCLKPVFAIIVLMNLQWKLESNYLTESPQKRHDGYWKTMIASGEIGDAELF